MYCNQNMFLYEWKISASKILIEKNLEEIEISSSVKQE
jgi:hypothetical protein